MEKRSEVTHYWPLGESRDTEVSLSFDGTFYRITDYAGNCIQISKAYARNFVAALCDMADIISERENIDVH